MSAIFALPCGATPYDQPNGRYWLICSIPGAGCGNGGARGKHLCCGYRYDDRDLLCGTLRVGRLIVRTALSTQRRAAYYRSVCGATALSYAVTPPGGDPVGGIVNTTISVGVIVLMAVLVIKDQTNARHGREQSETL